MIYICIPAHNEERTIGVVLWKIRQVMASFPRDYQILVANDGSTDATAEILEPYQRVLPLTVLHLPTRCGYATSLELLLREAVRRADYPKRDVIVTVQADFTEDPEHVAALLKRVEAGADIVCTNADLPENAPRSLRWARKVGKALLQRSAWPEGVNDPLSGYRAYRVHVVRKALEAVGEKRLLTWQGWSANAELLRITMPHARRTDALSSSARVDRRQRITRHAFWGVVPGLFRFALGGTGPLAGQPLQLPAWAAASDARPRRRTRQTASEGAPETRPARRTRSNAAEEGPRRRREEGETPRRRKPKPNGRSHPDEQPQAQLIAESNGQGEAVRKRKKRRRKRRSNGAQPQENGAVAQTEVMDSATELADVEVVVEAGETASPAPKTPGKRRRGRRGRGRRGRKNGNTGAVQGVSPEAGAEEPGEPANLPPPVNAPPPVIDLESN